MMYAKRYIETAVKIIKSYHGDIPFHLYLKKYFSADKKYGSRDRKQITSLCYNYFRLGSAAGDISIEDRIVLGTFLCENKPSELLQSIKPEWNELVEKPVQQKLSFISQHSLNIFPYKDELSEGIDAQKFSLSFLIQPDLFQKLADSGAASCFIGSESMYIERLTDDIYDG